MNETNLETTEIEVEEVEIELFVKEGKSVPKAKRYVIRMDKQKFTVHTATITGRAILKLAGKTPEKFKLYELKRGHQPSLVAPDQIVHLREHGIERFTTMPKDTTEGEPAALDLHRMFRLPAPDEDYLEGLGLPWETITDRGSQWLVVRGWHLAEGYNVLAASLALLIPAQYSDAQLDMAYFLPALARSDGRAIGGLSLQQIGNERWQRWSRHRTAQNPWRIGIDDVASHLSLVDEWLRREVEGRR